MQNPGIVYGQQYISLIARRGKIDAFKESNSWHTTKKAVELYTRKVGNIEKPLIKGFSIFMRLF